MINNYELSIIIPALNEEADILETIDSVIEVFKKHAIKGEIIVVNDGSTDNTEKLVLEVTENNKNIKLVNHKVTKGIGSSFWSGYDYSKGEFIVFIPADNQNNPWEILRYLPLLDHVDIVIPFVFNNHVRSIFRNVLSYLYRFIINTTFLVNLNYTNGTVLYRKSILEKVENRSSSFFFNTDIIIRCVKMGYLFAEVPYKLDGRKTGSSKAISYPSLKLVVKGYFKLIRDLSLMRLNKRKSKFVSGSLSEKRNVG